MNVEVAIVGNGVAGYACAARLGRQGIRPLLIGRGLPVDRPPLSKNALAKGELTLLADAKRLDDLGVDRLDAMVDHADLGSRVLSVDDVEIEAEAIVLATGLSYRPPRIPGLEAAHVNATPRGMTGLVEALRDGRRRVAVVGGGLIGVETAATLASASHEVTVVELFERPLDRIHDPIPALAAATLEELGVTFLGGRAVESVVQRHGRTQVLYEGGTLDADVLVAATGGRQMPPPGVDPAAELPLTVDSAMRVPGYERVHAVGDVVIVPHARFGPIVFPHWDMAIGMGERAADAIAGIDGGLDRLPYWWCDIGPRRLAEVGWAGAVAEWRDEEGLHVGRDEAGEPVAVLVVDEPRRLREARALVGS